jgi:hypothetical protein
MRELWGRRGEVSSQFTILGSTCELGDQFFAMTEGHVVDAFEHYGIDYPRDCGE